MDAGFRVEITTIEAGDVVSCEMHTTINDAVDVCREDYKANEELNDYRIDCYEDIFNIEKPITLDFPLCIDGGSKVTIDANGHEWTKSTLFNEPDVDIPASDVSFSSCCFGKGVFVKPEPDLIPITTPNKEEAKYLMSLNKPHPSD